MDGCYTEYDTLKRAEDTTWRRDGHGETGAYVPLKLVLACENGGFRSKS